jgi:glycogen operon protein
MHVDGFRFDLASALARELHEVDKLGAFFDIIHQDPVLSQVKLIAEPWDLGEGGYQVGNFPTKWTEWNGKYRDAVRRFWRGDSGGASELATRLAGSSDLYEQSGRRPREHQLHHRARRVHAVGPGVVRAQTERGQWGGQP